MINELTLARIKKVYSLIKPFTVFTPIISNNHFLNSFIDANISLKLEFLQYGGCFKTRGAINNIINLNKNERKKGVVAVSAGNHAIAVAYASKIQNVNSKVIMFKKSNKYRINKALLYNSKVIIANSPLDAFNKLEEISSKESRTIIHPFDSYNTIQGSGTLGYEISTQLKSIDNIIISVGGGGLIGGVGSIIKQKFPKCKIIGVEPKGACGITQSLEKGYPLKSVKVNTIADSLGPPFHLDKSFNVCKNVIDEMILVSDFEMKKAMKFMFDKYRFVLEPAGVAGIAALLGPLKKKLKNQKTLVLLCGANIDSHSWLNLCYKM